MQALQTARFVCALSIVLFLTTACHRSSSSFSPVVTNLGLATSELFGDGDLWFAVGRESDAGGTDLNSDGDTDDEVVFLLEADSGVFLNTHLALGRGAGLLPIQAASGYLAVFAVSEAHQGNTDLNGDGDSDDLVLYAYDRATGTTSNLELAVPYSLVSYSGVLPAVENRLAAFIVTEAGQGNQDLNGDGDSADHVLFVYGPIAPVTHNTGIEPFSELWIGADGVAYYAYESPGSSDLNGDADLDDFVLQVYDSQGRVNRNTGLANFEAAPLFAAGTWVVPVVESAQGSSDLNGDGDSEDAVFFAFDAPTVETQDIEPGNLGLTATFESSRASADRFLLVAGEIPGLNDNLDGDLEDSIPVVYDPELDTMTSTRTAIVPPPSRPVFFRGDLAAFQADELAQGDDLDGDGNPFGFVVQVVDLRAGPTTNLALDSFRIASAKDLLLILRLEGPAGMDWNRDGDEFDPVLHIWDPATIQTTNTGISSSEIFGGTDERLLLYSQELFEGRDLNGDGNLDDPVFVLHDVVRGRPFSLGLAGDFVGVAALAENGRAIFMAAEQSQGEDLNGDGDLLDQVLHISETLNMAATPERAGRRVQGEDPRGDALDEDLRDVR